MQGPLTEANLVETARHCQHWRVLFPEAELILAISSTDLLDGRVQSGAVDHAEFAELVTKGGMGGAATRVILQSCDQICLAEAALPLPPIKVDAKGPNNVNLQIAAARAALALARGDFVLRVRSDLVFLDRSFIDQWVEAERMPRGPAAALTRRVLISWLYTLNPFTTERLPLHFSDWFHFGALEDVRRLWDIPPMALHDAIHYATHRHATGSNAAERLFTTRLAVEQYLVFHALRGQFPALALGFHNDRSAVDLSLEILLDNFALCDVGQARCVFPKYAHEFDNPRKLIHCLTRDDWFAMAASRQTDYRRTLAAKIDAAERGDGVSVGEPVPRTIAAAALFPDAAERLNGELVAASREGTLFTSQKIALPAGQYRACLIATTLEGTGSVALQISRGGPTPTLAECVVAVQSGRAEELAVAFDLVSDVVDLVLTCRFEGLRSFAVAALALERRPGTGAARFQQCLPRSFSPGSLRLAAGALLDGRIAGGGQDGTLFFGPYAWILPGLYTARLDATALEGHGEVTLEITLDFGKILLARRHILLRDGEEPELSLDFDVPGDTAARFEIVCATAGVDRISVTGVSISARSASRPLPPRPRPTLRRRLGEFPAPFGSTRRGPA